MATPGGVVSINKILGERPVYCNGSYPPREKGLQRRIRHTPRRVPRMTPYFSIASIVYAEQVGIKRQLGGKMGEIKY